MPRLLSNARCAPMKTLHDFYKIDRAKNMDAITNEPMFAPTQSAAAASSEPLVQSATEHKTLDELKEYRAAISARVTTLDDEHANKVCQLALSPRTAWAFGLANVV